MKNTIIQCSHHSSRTDEIYERLKAVNWTFEEARTCDETHGIHPYPAKFIPQIPRELISVLYPNDGTAVMDPFCGSGTTLVEAASAGIAAIGVDLHPLACLISKVKVTPLSGNLIEAVEDAIDRSNKYPGNKPLIPAIDHWFKTEIQIALTKLMKSIDQERNNDIRDALRIAISSIIVRVSNQESDTRYAAIEKQVSSEDVFTQFRRSALALDKALKSTWSQLFSLPEIKILNKDILEVTPDDIPQPVSLVVTSPPYPNAYEYWLYHKYRMYWLGMDPISVREREIGARPHYFKKNPHTAADFERQMGNVFRLLSSVMTRNGHVCFQIGSSIIRGKEIDNAMLLHNAARKNGFELATTMKRKIPNQKKSFNPSHARIKSETILVFRLEAQ